MAQDPLVRVAESLEEVARLLALTVTKEYDTQKEAILALRQAGFEPPRIAALLGIRPNTVHQTLGRERKK